jgi:hypothetical protein
MLISYIAIDESNEVASGLLDVEATRFTAMEVSFIFKDIKIICKNYGMDMDNLLIYFKEIEGELSDIID